MLCRAEPAESSSRPRPGSVGVTVAVPKKKKSRMRRDRRRAHHDKATVRAMAICATCGSPMVPHRACPACGHYKGRKIFETGEEIAED